MCFVLDACLASGNSVELFRSLYRNECVRWNVPFLRGKTTTVVRRWTRNLGMERADAWSRGEEPGRMAGG